MSNIQEYVNNILSKRYGKDVRKSFCDAILEVDSVSRASKDSAAANAATAAQKASEAKTSANAAKASEETAAQSEANAKTYAENAATIAGAGIATQDTAGFMKGGDNYVDVAGTLTLTETTTDRTLLHSHAGGLRIESVAGESVQESTIGKNLFDYETAFSGNSNIEINEGVITSTTTSQNTVWTYDNSDLKITLPAGTYYLRLDKISSEPETSRGVNVYDENDTVLVSAYGEKLFSEISFTIDKETNIGIMFKLYVCSFTIQLSTKASLPWEPYTGGQPSPSPSYPQEVESSVVSEIKVVGANWFDVDSYTGLTSHCSLSVENGKIIVTAKGTANDVFVGWVTQYREGDLHIPVVPNTEYYLKFNKSYSNDSNRSSYRVMVGFFDNTKNVLGREQVNSGQPFVTPDNCTDMVLRFGFIQKVATANEYATFSDIILSVIDTEYQPYEKTKTITISNPITLHGIGEAKDRIVKQDGVWGVERNIGEVVFDGSSDEGWYINGTDTEGVYRLSAPINGIMQNNDNNIVPIMLSSQFIPTTPGGTYLKTEGISAKLSTLHVYCEEFNTNDINTWKTHLQNAPMKVLYELATPTFKALPEADQIALHSLVTYDTVTYLSTDSEIEPVVTVAHGTSKVGAEGIWNANRVVVLEREKEASEAELNAEIETLRSNHNIITYSAFEQIPGYTPDMTLTQVVNAMQEESILQIGTFFSAYSNLGLPDAIKGCMGVLTIQKADVYVAVSIHDHEENKLYIRNSAGEWGVITATAL